MNTCGMENPTAKLRALTEDAGFDDVFVYAAVPAVVEMADTLLAEDGCLNFSRAQRIKILRFRLTSTTCITTVPMLWERPAVRLMT